MNICCGDNMTKNGHDLFFDLMFKSCQIQLLTVRHHLNVSVWIFAVLNLVWGRTLDVVVIFLVCDSQQLTSRLFFFFFLKWKMCSKQSQLTDCRNAMKREQKLIIGTIDYSDWCEVTPLIVISCRGPSSLCCFHSGRRSAGSQCSQPNPSHQHTAEADGERWPYWPGPRGALLSCTSSQLSIVSSSVWATGNRVGQRGVY